MAPFFDIKKLQAILQSRQQEKNYPKHIVINLFPVITADETKAQDYQKLLGLFDSILDLQKEKNIPILTVSLGKREHIDEKQLCKYCEQLLAKANENRINITVFGRWYDLGGQLVEALKKINNETKEFDYFFLNLCVNYDGKQEIADACRVMVKKALLEKLDTEAITPETVKENVYSSYFIPPELVIEPDAFSGTFLWDSAGASIASLSKPVLEISKADIDRIVDTFAEKRNA